MLVFIIIFNLLQLATISRLTMSGENIAVRVSDTSEKPDENDFTSQAPLDGTSDQNYTTNMNVDTKPQVLANEGQTFKDSEVFVPSNNEEKSSISKEGEKIEEKSEDVDDNGEGLI